MKINDISIYDYFTDDCESCYFITLDTDNGKYDGKIYTFYNDISISEIENAITEICGNVEIENDIFQLRNMFKEETILKR